MRTNQNDIRFCEIFSFKGDWKMRLKVLFGILTVVGTFFVSEARADSCVGYVKAQKPEYAAKLTNGQTWVLARDLFDLVYDPAKPNSNLNRGYIPTVGSILVLEKFGVTGTPSSTAGHAGIVTAVQKDTSGKVVSFTVTHSNWVEGKVTTGTFRFVSNLSLTYDGGTKQYPLRGFVYRAK